MLHLLVDNNSIHYSERCHVIPIFDEVITTISNWDNNDQIRDTLTLVLQNTNQIQPGTLIPFHADDINWAHDNAVNKINEILLSLPDK